MMLSLASAAQTSEVLARMHQFPARNPAARWTLSSSCRCNGAGAGFQLYSLINDVGWDLRAFVGYAPVLGAKVVAFRGTDSHSWCGAMFYAPWTALPLSRKGLCALPLRIGFHLLLAPLYCSAEGPSENYQ
jgi:hypothetical protein